MVTPYPRSPDTAPTRAVPRDGAAPGGDGHPQEGTAGWGARAAGHPLEPGSRLGAYRLDHVVGEGGMGVVWLALDAEHRAVALKVLRPHIAADPSARRRLAREVATLERVRSPRVAEVLTADVDGPFPHLVTRYVPGKPLDAVVEARGPLRGTALRDLGHGLAEALRAIHAAGVVHRDLKPGNVLLLDGLPVVIDFGIAHVADDVRLTSTGLVMGTPGYLSPEVVAGGLVSPATDWWGWAATVAYAASGRPPFGRGPMEVVLDRVRRADVDLTGVPAHLRDAVGSALAVNPAHRPAPDDLLAALDGATSGAGGASAAGARPAGPPTVVVDPAPVPPPFPEARPEPPRSRFHSIIGDPGEAATQQHPVVPPAHAAGHATDHATDHAADHAADHTAVLPPVRGTGPTRAVPGPAPAPPGRWGQRPQPAQQARQAPPGWIPRVPGPDPARAPAPHGPPTGPAAHVPPGVPARPAGPPLGTNGQPARPQRTWTLLVGLLALLGVVAVAPTAGAITAFALGTLARTVDRAAARLFRRRWEAGPRASDAWAVGLSSPWLVLRAALSTALASVVPLLVAVSVAFIGGTVSASAPDQPLLLALGGLAGLLTAWWGPGSRSLQRGARAAVRGTLRGERETAAALAVLGLVAVAALVTALGGAGPDWWPLARSPFDRS
ncbi:serine/threonine-protein kinase [Kineococcus sp. SYSU DK004]|uniref:serine/threonine-protein kinase n=1 Tax=Kineococcus sp. SYSU DK004 TaxID=3383125 RepID=UPI003D7E9C68